MHPTHEEIITVFDGFRQELDDHNDRRERLIKLSREVTNLSKKIIFLLHRQALEQLDDKSHAVVLTNESRMKFVEIKQVFQQMLPELEGENFWRHQKTISPGLQEYIEALSFSYYLENNRLISYQQVQEELRTPEGDFLLPLGVPYADYVLGISDLTGELMRFAISSIGHKGLVSQGNLNRAVAVCGFVRDCRADWEPMTPYIRELKAKQDVTTESLRKIEEVAYSVAIRGLEKARLYGQPDPFPAAFLEDTNDENTTE